MTAKQIREAIRANVDAYHNGTVDYDRFNAEQRRLWDTAAASPRKLKAVTGMIRRDIDSVSPVCDT